MTKEAVNRFARLIAASKSAVQIAFAWLDEGLEFERTTQAFVGTLFLIRGARNFNAVQILCEAGYAVEAQTMLRTMVEDVVTLSYISTKPEKLAEAWLTFENPRLAQSLELLAKAHGQNIPEGNERPRFARWTRLSLFQMAEKADRVTPGIAEYLDFVYPVLSDRAHGNTSSSTSYARTYADGTIEALYKPSPAQADITLSNAITIVLTTAERAQALGVTIDLTPLEAAEREIYAACGLAAGLPPVAGE
ncbi:MAG: hypothetical protein JXR33_09650 [Coriobacteriia bacterium]|nr:hypothetical protein [Coriobacteriia bacterium]